MKYNEKEEVLGRNDKLFSRRSTDHNWEKEELNDEAIKALRRSYEHPWHKIVRKIEKMQEKRNFIDKMKASEQGNSSARNRREQLSGERVRANTINEKEKRKAEPLKQKRVSSDPGDLSFEEDEQLNSPKLIQRNVENKSKLPLKKRSTRIMAG